MDMRITKKESGINRAKESRKRVQQAKATDPTAKSQVEKLSDERFKRSQRAIKAQRPRGAFKHINDE